MRSKIDSRGRNVTVSSRSGRALLHGGSNSAGCSPTLVRRLRPAISRISPELPPHVEARSARVSGSSSRLPAPPRSPTSRSSRGETINAAWLLTAAVCTYAIAYRFYSKFIAAKIFALDANAADAGRATRRRPRLRADEPLDRVRPPLRGDRRPRTARRPDARRAVRLPARRHLDHRRRRARRRGAGLRHPLRRRFAATASRSARWRARRSDRSPASRRSSRCSAS